MGRIMQLFISLLIIVACFLRLMYLEEKCGAGEYFSEGIWWFLTGDDSGVKRLKDKHDN